MAREKPPDPPEDDVPAWVMTFSDVITLLMTFFILLLTFATNQPETFDRMQVAMFGGGGSTGFAGQSDGMEKDSLLMRERARSGRMAAEGSEIPPIHSDPGLESLANGISGLEEQEVRVLSTSHRIGRPLDEMVDAEGNITATGSQQLRMLATQMRKRPVRVDLIVNDEAELGRALKLAEHLTKSEQIPETAVGVGIAANHAKAGQILMIVAQEGANRGPQD